MGQGAGREGTDRTLIGHPSPRTLLIRGLTRRCPVCGGGRLFERWFSMVPVCPTCGFTFEREPGHWTGSLGLNTVISFGALLVTIVVGVIVTAPDIAVVPLVAASCLVAVVAPLLAFPYSRTLWSAVDLMLRPLEDGEVVTPGGAES